MNNEQIAVMDEEQGHDRTGPPWENREQLGFFTASWETIKGVLINPAQTFADMKIEGGIGTPILYAIILGSIGGIIGLVWQGLFSALGSIVSGEVARFAFNAAWLVLMAFFMPFFITIGLFIGSGIAHLCLMIVGGANKGFEATFRVFAYTSGSIAPMQIVPICGGIVGFVWGIVCEIIGLREAHETTTGKALLAIFLPLIIVCFGGLLLISLFLGMFGAGILRNTISV